MIDGNSEEDIEHIHHGNGDYVYDEDVYGDDCDQFKMIIVSLWHQHTCHVLLLWWRSCQWGWRSWQRARMLMIIIVRSWKWHPHTIWFVTLAENQGASSIFQFHTFLKLLHLSKLQSYHIIRLSSSTHLQSYHIIFVCTFYQFKISLGPHFISHIHLIFFYDCFFG